MPVQPAKRSLMGKACRATHQTIVAPVTVLITAGNHSPVGTEALARRARNGLASIPGQPQKYATAAPKRRAPRVRRHMSSLHAVHTAAASNHMDSHGVETAMPATASDGQRRSAATTTA